MSDLDLLLRLSGRIVKGRRTVGQRSTPFCTAEALTRLGGVNLDGNQTSIREAIDAGLLAGAVTLVWQAGKVLQVNELGHRDVHAGSPMQRDTIFRIASMSKPVTVAAAMALVEEGKFALADPVAPQLPELAELRVMADPDGPLDRTVPCDARSRSTT